MVTYNTLSITGTNILTGSGSHDSPWHPRAQTGAAGAAGAAGAPNVVSVKDAPFNAAGNGVADDTKAIQAAINYATANNYCHIRDIQIDGNKKNNTTGDGIHISDGARPAVDGELNHL
jgi:hypothetical protein